MFPFLLLLLSIAVQSVSVTEIYQDPKAAPADRAKDLLKRLSLQDKLVYVYI
jgi:trehalose-6-phosphatase